VQQLTAAIEQGGHLPALLAALAQREEERAALRSELEALGEVMVPQPRDRKALERALRSHLTDWRSLLRSQMAEARQVLETLLEDRLVFTPERNKGGGQRYLLRARFAFGRAFSAILRSLGDTSPKGLAPFSKDGDRGKGLASPKERHPFA
jgi:hypothetical protein